MNLAHDALLERLASQGFPARIVSIRHLADLRDAIEARHQEGSLDEEFYRERLTSFQFCPPDDLPGARSLIVLAYRDPLVRFTFRWKGQPVVVSVPPTYLHAVQKEKQIESLLAEELARTGHRLAPALLPEKLLSVRCGLAAYGRNNITFVEGMGSYQRPVVFYSDLPCEDDEWSEPRAMELCGRCTACARACPTGAISGDRFLLHAERCITFWNEKRPAVSFPTWMDPAWHNCLVGCMLCQTACPENRGLLVQAGSEVEFSEEETGLLLEETEPERLAPALVAKLRATDLLATVDSFPRNLGVLLRRDG